VNESTLNDCFEAWSGILNVQATHIQATNAQAARLQAAKIQPTSFQARDVHSGSFSNDKELPFLSENKVSPNQNQTPVLSFFESDFKKLKTLSDDSLEDQLKGLVSEERKILVQVLIHLREVERRMLYAKRGYSSLEQYCMEVLKYSGSAAARRVHSMRLAREIPEIIEKV